MKCHTLVHISKGLRSFRKKKNKELMKRTTRYQKNDIAVIVNKEIVQINRLAG